MALSKLTALDEGNILNSNGADVAAAVNSLVDVADNLTPKNSKITQVDAFSAAASNYTLTGTVGASTIGQISMAQFTSETGQAYSRSHKVLKVIHNGINNNPYISVSEFPAQDWSPVLDAIMLTMYIPTQNDLDNIGSNAIRFQLNEGGAWRLVANYKAYQLSVGFNLLLFSKADLIAADAAYTFSNVQGIKFRLTADSIAAPLTYYFLSLDLVTTTNAAPMAVVIGQDDGNDTTYSQFYTELNKVGLRGTLNLIPGNMNASNIEQPQVQEMYDSGFAIGWHDTDPYPGMTVPEMTALWQANHDFSILHGWTRGQFRGTYPQGDHNKTVIDAARNFGFTLFRTTQGYAEMQFEGNDFLHFASYGLGSTDTAAALIQRLLDEKAAGYTVSSIHTHLIKASAVGTNELEASEWTLFCQGLKELQNLGVIKVVTIDEVEV